MELFDILGAGCIACGPETIEVLQQRFAKALTAAHAGGIIEESDDLDILAAQADTHPEQSGVWSDLYRLPARYSALVFLQWAARDLQRALKHAPDWYEAAARGHMNITYAEAMAFALAREQQSGDAARGSRRGTRVKQSAANAKEIHIYNLALSRRGMKKEAAAHEIAEELRRDLERIQQERARKDTKALQIAEAKAQQMQASAEWIRQFLSKKFPGKDWFPD